MSDLNKTSSTRKNEDMLKIFTLEEQYLKRTMKKTLNK